MKKYGSGLTILILYLTAFVLFSFSRMLIVWFNPAYFQTMDLSSLLHTFFAGIRFDWVSFSFLSSLSLILLLLSPFLKKHKFYRLIFFLSLFIPFIGALLVNISDALYYPFTLSRSTSSIFQLLSHEGGFSFVWIDFLRDYWYAWIAGLTMIAGYGWIGWKLTKKWNRYKLQPFWQFFIFWMVLAAIWVIGSRGGLQYKPISIQSASLYSEPKNIPVVLNTPFTVFKTLKTKEISKHEFMTPQEQQKIFSARKKIVPYRSFQNKNLVIIILESFSRNHISYYNPKIKEEHLTPFLDSLLQESITYKGISNGKQSIQALPAIVSSIPSLMPTPFSMSAFSINNINSIASILAPYGYHSSFFHGGTNGTMGFDAFLAHAGFDSYFGLNEMKASSETDGKWGIWDEDFFRFTANQLQNEQTPFFSVLFTLSSHHPYKVPSRYDHQLPEGSNKIHKTIAYTDRSLRQFFERIKKDEWYENTLFVLTADHTSEAYKNDDVNELDQFTIPLAFFDPSAPSLNGVQNMYAQQTDIMPSVLSYLGIDTTIVCFGKNLFMDTAHYPIMNHVNFVTNLYHNDTVLLYNGSGTIGVYDFSADPTYRFPLTMDSVSLSQLELKVQAYLQEYAHRMIDNQLIPSK